jgi:hypothetical protein
MASSILEAIVAIIELHMTDKRYKKLIRIYSVIAGVAILTSVLTGSLRDILFARLTDDTGWVIAISAWLNIVAFILLFSLMLTRIELTPKLEKECGSHYQPLKDPEPSSG